VTDIGLLVVVMLQTVVVAFLAAWVIVLARAVKRLNGVVTARTGAPVDGSLPPHPSGPYATDPLPRHLSDTGPAVSSGGGSANSGIVVNGPHIRRRFTR